MSDGACAWPWATYVELLAIYSLWLPLLCLGVCRNNQALHQVRILLAPGLEEGQLKPQSSQRPTFAVRLNHWKNLQLYSTTCLKLHRVRWEAFCGWGYCFPSAAIWRGVICLRDMASAVSRMIQHRDPGSCSFSSLSRATNPSLSSSISHPLCPPSSRALGKWLQMKFRALVR